MTAFCKQCNNMLYMSYGGDESAPGSPLDLIYHCKNCAFRMSSASLRAERNMGGAVQETTYGDDRASYKQFITPYLTHDPTLPHVSNIACANGERCTRKPDEANDVILVKYDPVNLNYLYHCVHCRVFWKSGGVIEPPPSAAAAKI